MMSLYLMIIVSLPIHGHHSERSDREQAGSQLFTWAHHLLIFITIALGIPLRAQDKDSVRIECHPNGDTLRHYLPQLYDFTRPTGDTPPSRIRALLSPPRSTLLQQRNLASDTKPTFQISPASTAPKWTPSIPYTKSLTPTGAITYSVPIETAPGYKYAPQIALTYSSQSSNGVAGYGWSLSGLSSILEVDRSIHYDGVTTSVKEGGGSTRWDALRLDGVRLVHNTSSLVSEYPYITEQGKVLVKYHSSNRSYEARFPDGSTALYERAEAADLGVYVCSRRTDLRGYEQLYTYQMHDHTPYIARITYRKGSIAGASGSLTFVYEPRQDTTEHYRRGVAMRKSLRLHHIQSYDGGTLLGTYTLSYKRPSHKPQPIQTISFLV